MKPSDIMWLHSLDPNKAYGTLQNILQDADLNSSSFENVLKYLLKNAMVEKETLMKENKAMKGTLMTHGLYTIENIS